MDFKELNKQLINKQKTSIISSKESDNIKNYLNRILNDTENKEEFTENLNLLFDLLKIREVKKGIESKRKECTKEFVLKKKEIDNSTKEIESLLSETENILLQKIEKWVIEEDVESLKLDNGSLSSKKIWEWELDNIDNVPREYLTVDHAKIDKDIKNGIRSIEGIKTFEKTKISIRAKN